MYSCAGSEVTAGTVNVEGRIQVRVSRAGNSTTMADILRLVEAAQGRTAPIQRVADAVSGKFSVGVMLASSATLAFWAAAGPRLFPKVSAPAKLELGKVSSSLAARTPSVKQKLRLLPCNWHS